MAQRGGQTFDRRGARLCISASTDSGDGACEICESWSPEWTRLHGVQMGHCYCKQIIRCKDICKRYGGKLQHGT